MGDRLGAVPLGTQSPGGTAPSCFWGPQGVGGAMNAPKHPASPGYGLCQCGCGQMTSVAVQTHRKLGYVKGEPVRFVRGHWVRTRRGRNHPRWQGGRKVDANGYVRIHLPGHPRADCDGYVFEHVVVAESAAGRLLPDGAEVHHVSGVRDDNAGRNLVICENHAYHALLHLRARARSECGNPDWRKCQFCDRWDDPANLYTTPSTGRVGPHRECANRDRRARREALCA